MALMPTANALVPMATCGSETPTTYSNSGTARIDPPPPINPSENPTIDPQRTVRSECIFPRRAKPERPYGKACHDPPLNTRGKPSFFNLRQAVPLRIPDAQQTTTQRVRSSACAPVSISPSGMLRLPKAWPLANSGAERTSTICGRSLRIEGSLNRLYRIWTSRPKKITAPSAHAGVDRNRAHVRAHKTRDEGHWQ